MTRHLNAKMCGLALILMLLVGCSGSISIDSREMPNTDDGLAVAIAGAESEIDGLTTELEVAKVGRDAVAKQAETAEGWYQRENAENDLQSENFSVRIIASRLTSAKSHLAKLKAKQNVRQSNPVRSRTPESVSEVDGAVCK